MVGSSSTTSTLPRLPLTVPVCQRNAVWSTFVTGPSLPCRPMGKRARKRDRAPKEPVATTDYADDEGNVLTLRDSLSAGTVKQLRDLDAKPAATAEDKWQRREEFLFERFAVGWSIAGLPLETQ